MYRGIGNAMMPGVPGRLFHHRRVDLQVVLAAKRGHRVTVCIPARDEETTVGRIVRTIRRELVDQTGLVDEVLVVDDGSSDATSQVGRDAGARVVRADDVLPEAGPGSGKGEAMWKGLAAADGDLVVYCDADVRNFGPRFVVGLLAPLLLHDDVGFVKAFYERPLEGQPGEGGRVTELVARPLLSLLFPDLTPIVQPLAGECAARRDVLEQVPFVEGYGVDIGLVIDVAGRFGLNSIAQVDLGVRHHRNRPLEELAPQSMAIIQTVLARAGAAVSLREDIGERGPLAEFRLGRRSAAPSALERPPTQTDPRYSATTSSMQARGWDSERSRP